MAIISANGKLFHNEPFYYTLVPVWLVKSHASIVQHHKLWWVPCSRHVCLCVCSLEREVKDKHKIKLAPLIFASHKALVLLFATVCRWKAHTDDQCVSVWLRVCRVPVCEATSLLVASQIMFFPLLLLYYFSEQLIVLTIHCLVTALERSDISWQNKGTSNMPNKSFWGENWFVQNFCIMFLFCRICNFLFQ